MNVSDTRMVNLLALYQQFRDANSHLPDRGMGKLFSEKLGISNDFFSHLKCGRKTVGHALARRIEIQTSKPEGWLDQEHSEIDPKNLSERNFMETVMAVYRSDPAGAQQLMMTFLKKGLGVKS